MANVTIDQMRDKLLTIDELRTELASTEPVSYQSFAAGDPLAFDLAPEWNHGIELVKDTDSVNARVRFANDGPWLTLTKEALLEFTSAVGLSKSYVQRAPAHLITPQLDWWFHGGFGQRDFKALQVGAGDEARVTALTKATIQPFSNLTLLDKAQEAICQQYGDDAEIFADYKRQHNLRQTSFRLIVPGYQRVMTGPGTTTDDTWSAGVQIRNSLIGLTQTQIDGYLFRWWCTNGAIDTKASSGTWNRKSGGQGDDVYEWAREAVDSILGGLEHSFDAVEALTQVPLDEDAAIVLRDLFETYHVPLATRSRIIDNMVNAQGEISMYSMMQAVTEAANLSDLEPNHAEHLMRVGGDLPHVAHERCESCRRLTV
jgi:hypothetical protein